MKIMTMSFHFTQNQVIKSLREKKNILNIHYNAIF